LAAAPIADDRDVSPDCAACFPALTGKIVSPYDPGRDADAGMAEP
jgi:hypothetical protein